MADDFEAVAARIEALGGEFARFANLARQQAEVMLVFVASWRSAKPTMLVGDATERQYAAQNLDEVADRAEGLLDEPPSEEADASYDATTVTPRAEFVVEEGVTEQQAEAARRAFESRHDRRTAMARMLDEVQEVEQ